MKSRALLLSALLFSAVLAGSSAIAQPGPGGGRGWGMGQGMMGQGWGRGMMGEGWGYGPRGMMGGMMGGACPMVAFGDDGETTTFIDGRIAFLKTELKITDAQQGAWDGYAQAMKRNLETMKAMHASMQAVFDAESPVDRLQGRVAAMETRLTALKEMQPAVAKLYDVLDAKQKEAANELLTVMGCMM